MRIVFNLIIFIIVLTFAETAFAGMNVPANLQVALFYKIFDFDENLTESPGQQIVIGIFFDPANSESIQAKNEIKDNFAKLADMKIGNKNVVIREITAVKDLHDINIVYVTPGVSSSLSDIIKKCDTYKILGISGVEQYVQDGLAIAIKLNDQKPRIIINKTSAEQCGAKLSSKIMSLAQII